MSKRGGRMYYRADIYHLGRSISAGKNFSSKRAAAIAYDRAAILQGRRLTELNFPNGCNEESSDDEEDNAEYDDQGDTTRSKADQHRRFVDIKGYPGVSKFDEERYLASLKIDNKRYYLGVFRNKDQAAVAYKEGVEMFKYLKELRR